MAAGPCQGVLPLPLCEAQGPLRRFVSTRAANPRLFKFLSKSVHKSHSHPYQPAQTVTPERAEKRRINGCRALYVCVLLQKSIAPLVWVKTFGWREPLKARRVSTLALPRAQHSGRIPIVRATFPLQTQLQSRTALAPRCSLYLDIVRWPEWMGFAFLQTIAVVGGVGGESPSRVHCVRE